MTSDLDGKEVGTVDVDSPEATHTVDRVLCGGPVLGKTCRSDEGVNLAVAGHNVGNARRYGVRVGDVGVVGCDERRRPNW